MRSNFDRFQSPSPHDQAFQDVPDVLCELCERYFEQFDPDERICEDCQKCKKCGARIEHSLIKDSEYCMWCRDELSEPTEPQPNNIMFSLKEKQHIAAEVEKLLLSLCHPEMPAERPKFHLHVDGKADWSWADIEPNWTFESKEPGTNIFNEMSRELHKNSQTQ